MVTKLSFTDAKEGLAQLTRKKNISEKVTDLGKSGKEDDKTVKPLMSDNNPCYRFLRVKNPWSCITGSKQGIINEEGRVVGMMYFFNSILDIL
ncbi:hypothetical protein AALO_G00007850 [Alosa alosa]|uniref:Uncharacterized protein n=1 Tax=Alosa alosa TaxID=278164 RepID=A0AAV6HIV4_9TELE|nr:hypothetical protein AALO_G00007850 [Alosa alosa]